MATLCRLIYTFFFLNVKYYAHITKFLLLRDDTHCGVFWLNIAKFEVNLYYRYCSNLFRNLRKESEFRQYYCRNSTKVGERKRKNGREKFFIFGNTIAEIPFAYTCCRVSAQSVSACKENQMWQWHCRNRKK